MKIFSRLKYLWYKQVNIQKLYDNITFLSVVVAIKQYLLKFAINIYAIVCYYFRINTYILL